MRKIFNLAAAFVFALSLLGMPASALAQEPQPNPHIFVEPNEDNVFAWDWPIGTLLTLTIDDPATSQIPDYTTSQVVVESGTWEHGFELGDIFDIQPGCLVTVSDGNITKQHTVTHLTVTNIDIDTDTISGTATPGLLVHVGTMCDEGGCANRNLIVDATGNWLVDFSTPVNESWQGMGTFDLRLGSGASVFEHDEDWDSTKVNWNVYNPIIGVDVDIDRVQGWDWPLGAMVNFEIDDPLTSENPDYTNSVIVEAADWDPNLMYFTFHTNEYDVKPGDIVTATDGNTTKQLIVTTFRITDADLNLDIVYGVANPGQKVAIWTYDQNNTSISRRVTADEDGNWSANFAFPGDEDSEQGISDIRNGSFFDSFVDDEDWDCTRSMWEVPNPIVEVRPNYDEIHTYIWDMGNTLTLEIDDPSTADTPDYTATQTVTDVAPWDPSQTYVWFNLSSVYDIQIGDVVEISDGSIIKTIVVRDLAITNVHLDTDIVEGTAEPDQTINVWTCWQDICVSRDETADQEGYWLTNFAIPGEQDWEQDTLDVQPGSWIDSSVSDEDSDSTLFGWYVADQSPYFPFVVFGQEGVWLKENTNVISGDVAVNIASDGPCLINGSEVTIGQNTHFMDSASRVMGDTVYLKQGAQVFDVYYNELKGKGTVLGDRHTPIELPTIPQLPAVPNVSPGTQSFNLKKNATLMLDADSYGKLETKKGATITFTGGVYHFTEWNLGEDVKVHFTAPTEIRIAGKLDIGTDSFVGPATGSDVSVHDIFIYVLGVNGNTGNLGATPKAAKFGMRAIINANMYTPNGTLWIRERSTATGAFFGKWVEIGQNVTLTLDNGWR